MRHRGCGGRLVEDRDISYAGDDGSWHYALRCEKCRKEILGDVEIDLPEGHEDHHEEDYPLSRGD